MEISQRLLQSGVIDEAKLNAINASIETDGLSEEKAMMVNGLSPDVIREAFSQEYGVPAVAFSSDQMVSEEAMGYLAEDSARHYRLMPLKIEDGVLVVAANDPDSLEVREVLNFISSKYNLPYKLVFMLDDDIESSHQAYDSLTGEVDDALVSLDSDIEKQLDSKEKNKLADKAAEREAVHMKEDAPVTKIVATILRYAVDGGASDIHIEPTGEKVIVRFRVDGLLQKSLELPRNVQAAVVARVKILANMRLDEKRKPQDGRFSANFDGRKIDFRVSVLPTNHGEKVVMRILDNVRGVSKLEDTGISDYHLATIRRMVKEPYGIILISGPTGSGKSTTLYAMLSEIDKMTKNVLSLEDPVEYDIDNVSQSQVRPEIGYTFATGLRSALRQDPDVIMVGEIRDKETAQLAIQAALTGHLVLSTIHTNNSIGVIPRLIDMGVDPYLIAPTLKLAIAQRLARRICTNSGKEAPVDGAIKMMIEDEFSTLPKRYHDRIPQMETVLHPEPSPGCASGTKGRVAVMEIFEVDEEIQDLILKGGSEEDMFDVGRKKGFMSMKEDAIIKALEHVIPFEEVSSFGTKVGVENFNTDEVTEEVPPATAPVNDSVPAASPEAGMAANSETVDNLSDTEVIDV